MKLVVRIVISILVVMVVAYYGSVFVMPSVTIVNKSGNVVEQAEVALPNSNLNFGMLEDGEVNTLHYFLKQSDGVYNYQFKSENLVMLRGSCGYVTNNEIHKRVVITLNKNNDVVCD
ncbi:hypothetical protein KIH87_17445 [Paraneptunicella aestuarii]|uniref:hypothetical protein n=1 Tax=Paraneptunicella aestuarii TaxID=2831148 RepID=UPI001E37ED55|nr:hypothetical protein [Paraneptunicella aestuarii]UAA38441.1 hypothetical protein KIH87_17445 [Paraneptunicella aestuarii]